MKPKNKSLYLVVGFIVIILIILAVVFTTMKKNNDIPDTEDSLPKETDNTEEVIDTNNDKDNFIDALISIDETVLTEQEKFELIDFGKRIFSPVYDPPVSLITETGLDLSAVSSAPWTCVVTPDGEQTKTFYFQFNQKISASKFIWQVSFYPFSGGSTSVTDESNTILQSGELSNRATSLTVDFAKVYAAERAFFQPQLGRHNIDLSPNLIFKMSETTVTQALKDYNTIPLRTYYVRVFPVDNIGNSIANAGVGLPILYGDTKPVVATGNRLHTFITKFSLMLAKNPGEVTLNGEFPNNFQDKDLATMFNADTKTYSVLPSDYPANTQELLVQVSLVDFTQNDWNNTPGPVYEKRLTANDPDFLDLKNIGSTFGIKLDFAEFIPSDSNLPEDRYIRYYVRAIAMTDGAQPGTVSASYSETVIIEYGKNQSQGFKYYPEIKISP